jgi:outer membrane receptor protein involved in Fe transport
VRGSHAESYRAPELLELYLTDTVISTVFTDPRRPDLGAYNYQVVTGGNRDLRPEQGTSQLLAAGVEPWPGARLTVGRWWIDKSDVSGTTGLAFILANELNPAGSTASQIVRQPDQGGRPGEIIRVSDRITNLSRQATDGWDIDLDVTRSLGRWGELGCEVYVTYVRSIQFSTITGAMNEVAGRAGNPRIRARGTLTWERGPWSLAWATRWVSRFDSSDPTYGGVDGNNAAYVEHGITLGLEPREDVRLSFAVGNVFDTDPPRAFNNRGYQLGLYDNLGRTWSVSAEWRF